MGTIEGQQHTNGHQNTHTNTRSLAIGVGPNVHDDHPHHAGHISINIMYNLIRAVFVIATFDMHNGDVEAHAASCGPKRDPFL